MGVKVSKPMDLRGARKYLKQAMETQGPNFVYNVGSVAACYNVPLMTEGYMSRETAIQNPKSKTGCLVGTAMTLAGYKFRQDEKRHSIDWNGPGYGISGPKSIDSDEKFLTHAARKYLKTAQARQDTGSTWGDAFAAAEKWYEEYTALKNLKKRERQGKFALVG